MGHKCKEPCMNEGENDKSTKVLLCINCSVKSTIQGSPHRQYQVAYTQTLILSYPTHTKALLNHCCCLELQAVCG